MIRKTRCAQERERGSTVAEVVIILPIMMVTLLVAVQASVWGVSAELVQSSASVGSEVAADSDGSPAAGRGAALSYLETHGVDIEGEPIVRVDETSGGLVSVRVSATLAPSLLPINGVRVSATRVEPVQRFRESG
jgi:hypothetical protein